MPNRFVCRPAGCASACSQQGPNCLPPPRQLAASALFSRNCLQVALIAFLAHVGSFVPAASARVGLVDRIFTRLASREAAALPQSAFMLDLTQVAAMLRLSTERWVGVLWVGVGVGVGLERNRQCTVPETACSWA